MLMPLQRILIAVPRLKGVLPSAILPIYFEHRARTTGILLQECRDPAHRGIIVHMDTVERSRFSET